MDDFKQLEKENTFDKFRLKKLELLLKEGFEFTGFEALKISKEKRDLLYILANGKPVKDILDLEKFFYGLPMMYGIRAILYMGSKDVIYSDGISDEEKFKGIYN